MNSSKKHPKRLKKIILRTVLCIFTVLFLLVAFILTGVAVINYGPSETARDLFVSSMLETSAAKFLATWYFSEEDIAAIQARNTVVAAEGYSDPTLIKIPTSSGAETDVVFPADDSFTASAHEEVTDPAETEAPDTEKVVDDRKEDGVLYGNGLEIHDVSGSTYSGKMMIVYDPSRVFVGVCGDYSRGASGRSIYQIAKSYNATAAINGGGFVDSGGLGDGGTPIGVVISRGKVLWGDKGKKYDFIGFTDKGILMVGSMTIEEALEAGIRDALSFGPTLIMNGKASSVKGAGSGLNPRTAIGQRADGAVLMLVIDGRRAESLGATYSDLIDVMLQFGAVNAANLDGGNSSGMYYNGELVNKGLFTRGLPTCFIVE